MCEKCYEVGGGACPYCAGEGFLLPTHPTTPTRSLSETSSVLLVIAFLLVLVGVGLIISSSVWGGLSGGGSVGVVVLVGPFPLLFGVGEPPAIWVGVGLALTLLAVALTLLLRRREV